MQEVLLRKLIEKNYFKKGSEIDATYKGLDLSGQMVHSFQQTYTVAAIYETTKTNRIRIDAVSNVDGQRIRIGPENILNIDGMTPERFAENYMVDIEGNAIAPSGKRRGRRPKGWIEE